MSVYKRYLCNDDVEEDVVIPPATLGRLKKLIKCVSESQNLEDNNKTADHLDLYSNQVNDSIDNDNSESIFNENGDSINNEKSESINEENSDFINDENNLINQDETHDIIGGNNENDYSIDHNEDLNSNSFENNETDLDLSYDTASSTELDDCKDNELTKFELCIATMAFFYGQNLTQTSLKGLCCLIDLIAPGKVPKTFNSLQNAIMNENSFKKDYNKSFYCETCELAVILANQKQRQCETCLSKLSIYYHFDIKPQLKRIFNNILSTVGQKSHFLTEFIEDLYDGELYQTFIRSFRNSSLVYSLSINTDGISISNKSNLSIWPVFLTINELPLGERFCIQNVVVAGLVSVHQKPKNFNVFLSPIVKQLQDLEGGLSMKINGRLELVRFFLLMGVFDKPARASICNSKLCTGHFGCIKCYQPGKRVPRRDESSDENADGEFDDDNEEMIVEENISDKELQKKPRGTIHVYKFNQSDPSGPVRSADSYKLDLEQALATKKEVRGIKGKCGLNSLKFFSPLESTNIDYMHSVLYGVVKRLMDRWFSSEFKHETYSLSDRVDEVDKRLFQIKPPRFIPYSPRSIKIYSQWRCHEFLGFIVYYALVVFNGIMKPDFYENLIGLVVSIEHLLAKRIIREKLILVENLIIKSVGNLEKLYSESIMVSGFHELLHLVQCTLNFGPLNNVSCFQFEELNRKIKNMIKGKDLIGDEFIKVFSTAQHIYGYTTKNSNLNKYLTKNTIIRTSNRKYSIDDKTQVKFGRLKKNIDLSTLFKLNNLEQTINYKRAKNYLSVSINQVKYTTIENNSNFCDYCVRTKTSGELGLIEQIISDDERVFYVLKNVTKLHTPFYDTDFDSIKSNTFIVNVSNHKTLIEAHHCQKVFYCKVGDYHFASEFNIEHIFH